MITIELLKSWKPCPDGFARFCELFPDGTDLFTAGERLAEDGHENWGAWLYDKSRNAKMFEALTVKGYRNTGDWNTGDWNTGDRNTGYLNTGDWNTGDWNTGDWNTGFFNTDNPSIVRVFGKDCDVKIWSKTTKPDFLFFDLTYWVNESEMSDDDKKADQYFYIRGGQLRKKDYKEAFVESWNNADKDNRELVRKLPNFDAEIFYQISGIDLRTNH